MHNVCNRTEKPTAFPIWTLSQLSSHMQCFHLMRKSQPDLNNNARKLALQFGAFQDHVHSAISSMRGIVSYSLYYSVHDLVV